MDDLLQAVYTRFPDLEKKESFKHKNYEPQQVTIEWDDLGSFEISIDPISIKDLSKDLRRRWKRATAINTTSYYTIATSPLCS